MLQNLKFVDHADTQKMFRFQGISQPVICPSLLVTDLESSRFR